MKKIILTITLLISVNLFSQNKSDIIDYTNINYKLLNSLVFEYSNLERENIKVPKLIEEKTCLMASNYQSEYLKTNIVFSHKNSKELKGIKLVNPEDRFNFFKEKTKITQLYSGEILCRYEINLINKISYENLAKTVVSTWMNSLPHKVHLIKWAEYTTKEMFCGFTSSSIILSSNRISFYFVGVISYEIDEKKSLGFYEKNLQFISKNK